MSFSLAAGAFDAEASATLTWSATPLRLIARAPLRRRLARPAPATSVLTSVSERWAATVLIRRTLSTCTWTSSTSLARIRSSGLISLLPAMTQRYGSSGRR
ncbi:hypothetical protein ASD79_10620 [Caulobacter sp. Root655]|nr:hypothetical protein ASD79_10620 [Caulobacter sp. Root655]